MPSVYRVLVLLLFCAAVATDRCQPQATATRGLLNGAVTDPLGARVRDAAVHVEGPQAALDTRTDSAGAFSIGLPLGTYQLTISVAGFTPFVRSVELTQQEEHIAINAVLAIATRTEEITVPDSDESGPAGSGVNALVLEGNALDTLSSDDATFQQQVLSLVPGSGQAAQIYVDGFSGARFPPKNTIRSIRINQNSFSVVYDSFGFSRVEIDTKPGSEKLHGSFNTSGTSSALDTGDPYTVAQPPFYILKFAGTLGGPIDKKTSFLLAATVNDQQNNAAVNVVMLNSAMQLVAVNQAVPNPQLFSTYSARIDRQVSATNTFTGRYEFNQINLTNGGVGLLNLQDDGYDSGTTTQTVQLSDEQVIGVSMINRTRFQYIRTRLNQGPVGTTGVNPLCAACTSIVEGAFVDGPNPSQVLHDNQDRYELQEDLSLERKAHYFRFGGRFRSLRDANLSTANYNGEYIYDSLGDYPNQPSQYSITSGKPSAAVMTNDISLYAEDNWKASSDLTFNYGFRVESQSAVPDHFDPAERLSGIYVVRGKKAKSPFLTLRAGSGIFYDRFAASNILTAVRQNGVTQQTTITEDPFTNATPQPPTIYKINPDLRIEYEIFANFSASHSFGSRGSINANYLLTRGDHQYISRNINAPLPGTYNPAAPNSGTRPLGGTQNIYEFDANGVRKDEDVYVGFRFNPFRRLLSLYGQYLIQHDFGDAGGATTFPSNQYDVGQDYGRSNNSRTQILSIGGSVQLPFGIRTDTFFTAETGAPFDITTGTDLNGDTQFNERPSFATSASPAASIVHTAYGVFNTTPQPGEKIIPHNYAMGPSFVYLQVAATREFALGKRPASGKAATAATAPYHLNFSVEADNLPNRVNRGQPVGVLNSPLFGKSISLAAPFSPTTAASRIVYLATAFRF